MARRIRNGHSFPLEVKSAVLDELRAGRRGTNAIAKAYNMAPATVSRWGAAASIAPVNAQPTGLATYAAASVANTAAQTPVVHYSDVARTRVSHIMLNGRRYV